MGDAGTDHAQHARGICRNVDNAASRKGTTVDNGDDGRTSIV